MKVLLDKEEGFLDELILMFKFLEKVTKLAETRALQKFKRISSIILWIDNRYLRNLRIVKSK